MTTKSSVLEEYSQFDIMSAHPRLGPWSVRPRGTRVRPKCATPKQEPAVDEKTATEFCALASQWKRETAIFGNLSRIVMHPTYQRIMAMGPAVIPLILQDLSKKPGHWFWALHNLVDRGSDPAEGTTTIKDATQAWLEWGRSRKIL